MGEAEMRLRAFPLLVLVAMCASAAAQDLYPHAATKPKSLVVVDMRGESDYPLRCLAASAQGLVNSRPSAKELAYLIWTSEDARWLKWLSAHYVRKSHLETLADLVSQAGADAIVYDEKPSHLPDIATLVAGCERGLMVGDPSLLSRFHLHTKLDLRDRFKTNVEAYRWALGAYGKQMSVKALSITVPNRTKEHNPASLRDYLVANRIFTFWISGAKEASLDGADMERERAFFAKTLADEFPANIPVLGYPWSGDGYGPGEGDGVTLLSRAGKFLVPTDLFTNLSVWSAFPPSRQRLPSKPKAISYGKDQTYAAIVMSDGDNLCTYQNYWPAIWAGLLDRSFPIGWTMGPTLRELAPPIYEYAVAHVPEGHTTGSGVSGLGYVAVDQYAKGLAGSRAVVDRFIAMTEKACEASGESWLWLMRYGGPQSGDLDHFASHLRRIRTIMGGYGQVTSDTSRSIERVGNVTIFHAVVSGGNADEALAQIKKMLANPDHPRFFQIFLMNWGFSPADIERVGFGCKSLGVTLVTPEQLSSLYGNSLRDSKPFSTR